MRSYGAFPSNDQEVTTMQMTAGGPKRIKGAA
jgi:hypothetical protein